ncbi:hypothetical protein [Pararhodobacter sp. CCB-MM2]|nr:hypothetical protein [Pararhodobacter sp. CCB-MM2]
MSDFILAFVLAPIVVVAVGYAAVRLNERSLRQSDHRHPAE